MSFLRKLTSCLRTYWQTLKTLLFSSRNWLSPNKGSFVTTAFTVMLALGLAFQPIHLRAADLTWEGDVDTTWSGGTVGVDTNWTDGVSTSPNDQVIPSATGDTLTFTGTPATTTSNNDLGVGAITLDGISFTNDGSSGQTGQFTLQGDGIILGGAINSTTIAGGGSNLSDTIDLDLVLNSGRSVIAGLNHGIVISGDISESGGNFTLTIGQNNTTTHGLVTLSGNNTHSVTNTQRRSRLRVESNNALGGELVIGRGAHIFLADGLTLNPTNGIRVNNNNETRRLVLDAGTLGTTISSDLSVDIVGTASNRRLEIEVGGTNTLTLDGVLKSDNNNTAKITRKLGSGTLVLTAANTYDGLLQANEGTLQLSNALAAQFASLTNNGSAIVFDSNVGPNFTVGALNGGSNLVLEDDMGGAITLTIGGHAASRSYSGDLTGGGSVIINTNAGIIQTLNGDLTHTGSISVNGGRLDLDGTNATSTITVANGAALGGDGTTSADVTFQAGGILGMNRNDAGPLTIDNSSILNTSAGAGSGGLGLAYDGNRNRAGQTFSLIDHTNATVVDGGSGIVDDFTVDISRDSLSDDGNILSYTQAAAQTATWSGAAGSTWDEDNTASWDTSGQPVNDSLFIRRDEVIFGDTGAGTITVSGTTAEINPEGIAFNNTLGNDYTFNGDAINVMDDVAFNNAGNVTINNNISANDDFTVTSSGDVTLNGVVSGGASINHNGTGRLTLTSTNTHTGGNTVSSGATLDITTSGALGSTGITSAGGVLTVANGGTLDLNGVTLTAFQPGTIHIEGAGVGGLGALQKTGTGGGDDTIGDDVTFTGDVTISVTAPTGDQLRLNGYGVDAGGSDIAITKIGSGVVRLDSDSSALAIDEWILNEGELQNNNNNGLTGNNATVTVNNNALLRSFGNRTISNDIIMNGGSFRADGNGNSLTHTGSLTVNANVEIRADDNGGNADSLLTLAGVLTGAGNITTGNSAQINLTTATFDATGFSGTWTQTSSNTIQIDGNETINLLAATNTGAVFDLQGNTLTTGATGSTTYAGNITGSGGSLIKVGTGSFEIAGASTYTGTTAVNEGTLEVSGSLASSTVTVANGATLNLNNTGTSSNIVINGGGTLTGEGSTTGSITLGDGVGTGAILLVDANTEPAAIGTTGALIVNNTAGATTVNFTGINTSGDITILTHDGTTYAGDPNADFAIGTGFITSGRAGAGNFSNSGGAITVTTAFESKTWVGNAGTAWDIGSTANWTGGTDLLFYNGDFVTFTDSPGSGTGSLNPTLQTNIEASTVTFTNDTDNYTIDNAGGGQTLSAATGGINTSGAADVTVNVAIAGATAVNHTGTGTLTLSGASTYSGTTTLANGTVIANVADVVSTSGALGNGGDVTFTGGTLQYTTLSAGSDYSSRIKNSTSAITLDTNNETITYVGAVDASNTAGLTKTGTGTLILAGDNAYTGATTVSGGTLQIGNGGANGSLDPSSTITNDATLIFNRTDSLTQGTDFGTIGGTGNVEQAGSGTLIFDSDNTYTGSTTISSGTLQVGTGGTGGTLGDTTGDVINNSALEFNTSDNNTYSGVFSGSGTLAHNGSGNTTLSGNNTYTGTTSINAGTLTITGTNDSSITVGTGAGSGANLDGEGSTTGNITFAESTHTITVDGTTAAALGSTNTGGTNIAALTTDGFTVNLSATAAGVFDVLTYGSGGLTKGGISDVDDIFEVGTGPTVGTRAGAGTFTETANAIQFNTGIGDNVWNGPGSNWASGTDANWTNSQGDNLFFNGDDATFNDTGISVNSIALTENIEARRIVFDHTTGTYTLNESTPGVSGETLSATEGIFVSEFTTTNSVVINVDIVDPSGGGTTSLTKHGTGITTLRGDNSFSGGILLQEDVLRIESANAGGTGLVTIEDRGDTPVFDIRAAAGTYDYDFLITNTGNQKVIRFNDTTTGSVATYTLQGNITTQETGNSGFFRIEADNADIVNVESFITGNGVVSSRDTGTVNYLNDANNFSGRFGVGNGTATITSLNNRTEASAAGAGNVIVLGEQFTTGTLIYLGSGVSTDRQIQVGNDTGNGDNQDGGGVILNNGAGALVFNNSVSTNFNQLNGTSDADVAGQNLTLGGTYTGGINEVQGVLRNNRTNTNEDPDDPNAEWISLTVDGAAGSTWMLSGANLYTGHTRINGGTLLLNNANAITLLQANSDIIFGGGTLQYNAVSAPGQDYSGRFRDSTAAIIVDSNGQDLTFAGLIDSSNTAGFTKEGLGTLTLSAANTYLGDTTINGGTLKAGIADAITANSNTTVASGATLLLDGFAQTLGSLNGAGNVVNDEDTASVVTLTVGGADGSGDFSGVISEGAGAGTLSVTKIGSGTQTLSGNSTYTGATTVSAGTLNVTGQLDSAITLAAGATLSGEGSTSGGLTLDLGGSTLLVDASTSGAFQTTGVFTSTATVAGSQMVQITAQPTTTDNIVIIDYSGGGSFIGTVGASGVGDFTVSGLTVSARGGTFIDNTTDDRIELSTGFGVQTWIGGSSNVWDIETTAIPSTGTDNWSGADNYYYEGDFVIFDENGIAQNNIALNTGSTFNPTSITFSNNTAAYTINDVTPGTETISAAGGITINGSDDVTLNAVIAGSTDITHSGGGTLTLSRANTFMGDVIVNGGGTIVAGNDAFLGDTAANTLTISNGSTLDINGGRNLKGYGAGSITVSGAGNGTGANAGAIINSGGTAANAFSNQINLAGDTTIGGSGRIEIDGNLSTSGTDVTLTYVGSDELWLQGNNTNASELDFIVVDVNTNSRNDGIVVNNNNGLGNAVVNIEGGQLRSRGNKTVSNTINLNTGDASIGVDNGNNTFTLSGTLNVDADNAEIDPNSATRRVQITGALNGTANNLELRGGIFKLTNTATVGFAGSFDMGENGVLSTFEIGDGLNISNNFNLNGTGSHLIKSTTTNVAEISGNIATSTDTLGSFDVNAESAAGVLTLSGIISDDGTGPGLDKVGAGTVILEGANTYTGRTVVETGTLRIGDGATSGSLATASNITTNATLAFDRSDTVTQGVDFATNAIDGTGGISQIGSGTLVLNAANTYSGTTTIASGTLRADAADGAGTGALGNGGAITFTGGTLQYTNNSAGTDYSTRITGSTGSVSLDTQGESVTLASAIDATNTGGLTKLGSGTLTLNGDNAYAGATTVDNGTLLLNGNNAAATGAVTVNTGALGGSGTIGGAVNIGGSGNHTAGTFGTGTSTDAAVQTIAGDLTYAAGATLTWDLLSNSFGDTPGGEFDQFAVTGNLSFDTSLSFDIDFGTGVDFSSTDWNANLQEWLVWDTGASEAGTLTGLTVTFSNSENPDWNTGVFELREGSAYGGSANGIWLVQTSVIPEPGTFGLLGLSLASLGWFSRRRRRSASHKDS